MRPSSVAFLITDQRIAKRHRRTAQSSSLCRLNAICAIGTASLANSTSISDATMSSSNVKPLCGDGLERNGNEVFLACCPTSPQLAPIERVKDARPLRAVRNGGDWVKKLGNP